MQDLLWLVPGLPLLGFLVLSLAGGRLSRPAMAAVGTGSVGASAMVATLVALGFHEPFRQVLWEWMRVGEFAPTIGFRLDALSLVMILVITWVGFLIHAYSCAFMAGDAGYRRFFAIMNLFVAAMLTLVLADNLLFLYLGWEGVGLCSYLLIGFWYQDPANGRAARKAFIVTRVGDTAFAIGLFFLIAQVGTLDIEEAMTRAGSISAATAAALLLGGAVGKSAQIPLQVWLPDAMAGPTPVSALIHAATMVTAGVYLIARTQALFALAPVVQTMVAVIGAATLLLGGIGALAQRDIKRVLAYSTMSQIGLMFLALGLGAWPAAIFHFMTHAFFKALLFLAAGSVTLSLHHEHDIFRMGGLWKSLPISFATFLIGAASLSGMPFVTAGFFSKESILGSAWERGVGWWSVALVGVLLTSLYIFRVVFIVFFGEAKTSVAPRRDVLLTLPMVALAILALVGGWIPIPVGVFEPHVGVASVVSMAGIVIAWSLRAPLAFPGVDFDGLYERAFVRPFLRLANAVGRDPADAVSFGPAWAAATAHRLASATQTGSLRWYAAGIVFGGVVLLAVVLWW
ncbi:MAG: NADH-quinone oxidoreductase subunit L [Planctomycetes bacterium]|nr:NADH-quinone oxidoreductase subunit L [Planctomycetota bacterium]